MFYHMNLADRQKHEYDGNVFEIVVSRADEDGHLRGYISSGGFSGRIAKMSGETVSNIEAVSSIDPVTMLIDTMKDDISAGKYPLPDYLQKKVTERNCL